MKMPNAQTTWEITLVNVKLATLAMVSSVLVSLNIKFVITYSQLGIRKQFFILSYEKALETI